MVLIITAIFFVILGALIKYGKMYFLIAGYNTLPAEEKKKYDVTGIANVFWNAMCGMGILLVLGYYLGQFLDVENLDFGIFFLTVIIGTIYLLFKVNSDKYKIG